MKVETRSSVGTRTPKYSCTKKRSATNRPATHGCRKGGLTFVVDVKTELDRMFGGSDESFWTTELTVVTVAARPVGADTVSPVEMRLPVSSLLSSAILKPKLTSPIPFICCPLTLSAAYRKGMFT